MKKIFFIVALLSGYFLSAQYCTTNLHHATLSCIFGHDLDTVRIGNYHFDNTGCATPLGGYINYTTDTIKLQQLVNYPVFITTNQPSDMYLGIWVDINNDGDFADSTEFLLSSGTKSFGYSVGQFTGNLFLNTYVSQGNHRLRIRTMDIVVYDTSSCYYTPPGETHDYTLQVLPPPPCPAPTGLAFNAITHTSAQLSFNSLSGFSDIEYGPVGFAPGTGTIISGVTSPYTITGLNALTRYDIYVRDDCSTNSNGSSVWSLPIELLTNCLPVYNTPFTEDFDDPYWKTFGSIHPCWSRNVYPSWGYYYTISSNSSHAFSGPAGDHTTGQGQYLTVAYNQGSSGDTAWITTPLIDISSLNDPLLSFYYHLYGNDIDTLRIDMWSGGSWQYDVWKQPEIHTNGNQPYHYASIDLKGFSDTLKIRFRSHRGKNPYNGAIAVDDISVDEAPACLIPSSQLLLDIFSDSAITINTPAPINTLNFQADTLGFPLGSGRFTKTGVHSQDTLFGLPEDTELELYVQQRCSSAPDDTSGWNGPFYFLTPCATKTAPFSDDFTVISRDNLSPCWNSILKGNIAFSYIVNASVDGPYSPPHHILLYDGLAGPADEVALISPSFVDLPLGPKQISFYTYTSNTSNTVELIIATTPDPYDLSQATGIDTIQLTNTNDRYYVNVETATGYNGTDQYIAFIHSKSKGAVIYLDDFEYYDKPLCSNPFGIELIGLTDSSATFDISGPGAQYSYHWGPQGFNQGTGTVGSGGSPLQINNLPPNTPLDFYFQTDCSVQGNGNSQWIGTYTATTLCLGYTAPYFNDFESDTITLIPKCFTKRGVNNTPVFISTSGSPYSGSKHTQIYDFRNSGSPDSTIATFPRFDDLAEMDKQLSFYAKASAASTKLYIGTVKDGLGNGFSLIDSIDLSVSYTNYTFKFDSTSAYNGVDNYIALLRGNARYTTIYFDDVNYDFIPTCTPSIDSSINILPGIDIASVYWRAGEGIKFRLEWGITGYQPGSATTTDSLFLTDTTATLSGLLPNTFYDLYIQDSCTGISGYSPFVGPVRFLTDCDTALAVVLPFLEGFESDTGSYLTGINFCDTDHHWQFKTDQANLGRLQFNPTSSSSLFYPKTGTKAATLDALGTSESAKNDLILTLNMNNYLSSPLIALSFSYMNHQESNDSNDRVWIRGSKNDTWIEIYNLYQNRTQSGTYKDVKELEFISVLTANGQSLSEQTQIRFGQEDINQNFDVGYMGGWTFDDVLIEEPLCYYPKDIRTDVVLDTSITLTWTIEGSTAQSYDIMWGTRGFTQASTTAPKVTGHTSTSLVIDTLKPSTCYTFFVRANCIAGSGDWAGPFEVCTQCTVITAPYYEDFESINWTMDNVNNYAEQSIINHCWTGEEKGRYGHYDFSWRVRSQMPPSRITSGTPHGPRQGATGFGSKFIFSGGPFAKHNSGPDTAVITSPLIDISTLTNPYLKFQYHMFGSGINRLIVEIDDGNGWTIVDSIIGQQQGNFFDPWKTRIIDLNGYLNDTIQIALSALGVPRTREIGIDGVRIADSITCSEPDSLSASVQSCAEALVSWLSLTTASIVEVGYQGYIPGNGLTTFWGNSPVLVTGLQAGTSYDFYVADTCARDTGTFIGPFTFTTDSLPLPGIILTRVDSSFNGNAIVLFDASNSTNTQSFLWDMGNGNTDTSSSVNLVVDSNGIYTYTLTLFNDCGSLDTIITLNINNISITDKITVPILKLYPNPAKDVIHLSFRDNRSSKAVILIQDAQGRIIYKSHENNLNGFYKTDISLSGIASGMYFLSVRTVKGDLYRKFIKE